MFFNSQLYTFFIKVLQHLSNVITNVTIGLYTNNKKHFRLISN